MMTQLAGSALIVAWLLTYLMHSSVLLGAAWSIDRLWPRLRDATRESMWRVALLGGLITASAQLALGGGAWPVTTTALQGDAVVIATEPLDPGTGPVAGVAPTTDFSMWELARAAGYDVMADASLVGPAPAMLGNPEPASPWWCRVVAVGGSIFVIGGLLGCCLVMLRLSNRMRDRRPAPPSVLAIVDDLRGRAGMHRRVRVTMSDAIRSPLVIGLWRSEICLPPSAVELSEAQLECMLAHELGHIARRDPWWLPLIRVVELALPVQPLNRVAARRLRAITELRCDAWVVRQTRTALPLAECLVQVAEWIRNDVRRTPATVAAMASGHTSLERRIRRLLAMDPDQGAPLDGRSTPQLVAMSLAVLTLLVLLGPGVGAAHVEPAKAVPPLEPLRAESTPSDDPIAALDAELAALHAEIEALRREASASSRASSFRGTLTHLEQFAERLAMRRARLMHVDLDATPLTGNTSR